MWVHTLMCERIRYNYTMEFDITTQWNRWVCTSIKLSILGYAMESVYLPPAQERRFNSIDFQHMRRKFGQKSSYFRKSYSFPIHHARTNVFHNWPANSFRSPLHHNIALSADSNFWNMSFVMRIPMSSRPRSCSPELPGMYGDQTHGRPRLHWAESAMTEAYIRLRHQDTAMAPPVADVRNAYWKTPNMQTIKQVHNSDKLPWMDNTLIYRRLNPVAQDRMQWQLCLSQPRFVPAARNCLG